MNPLQHTPSYRPVSLQQAAEGAPTLGHLLAQARAAQDRLKAIQTLLPPGMRGAVKAGPLEARTWCLLVGNNAAAAKLRQLLPALTAHLRSKGHPVDTIRLKVETHRP